MNQPAGGHRALASYDSTCSTDATARHSNAHGQLSKPPDDVRRQSLTLPAAKVYDMAENNDRDDLPTSQCETSMANRSESPPEIQPESPARVLKSCDLLEGNRQVFIQHGTELYRLLLTRNGKLILQK